LFIGEDEGEGQQREICKSRGALMSKERELGEAAIDERDEM
jgi:hypothetical protein